MIVSVAFAIRVAFFMGIASDLRFGVDADYYRFTATSLTTGHGFTIRPADSAWTPDADPNLRIPATDHGPGQALVLSIGNLLGLKSWDQHRVLLSFVGAVGVGLTGVLGRRIAGPTVGLVAAVIATLHPLWVQAAGSLTSESSFFTVLPATLLVAHIAAKRRTLGWMAATGMMCAVAALTRSEAVLLVAFLGVPIAFLGGRSSALRSLAAVLVGAFVVLAPWLVWIRATTGEFTLSTNGGVTLAGSNCNETYYGPHLGSFNSSCSLGAAGLVSFGLPPDTDAGQRAGLVDRGSRTVAVDYLKAHERRLPVVVAARIGRTLGVFRVANSLAFDKGIGSHPASQRFGYLVNVVLLPFTAAGFVLVIRRRVPADTVALMAGPLLAVATGALVYGATRMRVSAEPAIAITAALAMCKLTQRTWRARSQPQPVPA